MVLINYFPDAKLQQFGLPATGFSSDCTICRIEIGQFFN